MPSQNRTRWFLVVLIVHFLALSAVWLCLPTTFRDSRSTDFVNTVEPVARNFLAGQGLREANGELMTRYPPGHTFFLIGSFAAADIIGAPENFVLGLSALGFQALSGALLYLLVSEVWSNRVAFLISLLWLAYPPALFLSIKANNEVTFTPLFLLSVWCAWHAYRSGKPWLFFGTGFLTGIGMLIRPFILFLPVFLLILCVSPYLRVPFRKRIVLAGVLLAGTGLAILPWQWWTYQQTSSFFLVSSVGVSGIMDGLTYGVPQPNRITLDLPNGVLRMQESAFQNWRNGSIDDLRSLLAWVRSDVAKQPLDMLSIIGRKALRTWYATDSHRWELKLLMMQLPFLVISCFGSILCLRSGGSAARIAKLAIVYVLFYWAMTMAGLSMMRYIVPVMPLMLLMSAPLVNSLLERLGFAANSPLGRATIASKVS